MERRFLTLKMSECALEFELLFVTVKIQFLDNPHISETLRCAINTSMAKLTKHYTKINTPLYAIAIVLDPRFKVGVFSKTQDPKVLTQYAMEQTQSTFNDYNPASKKNYLPVTKKE